MKKIINTLKHPSIETGFLYFYIHLITEITCFFVLARVIGDSIILWMTPFIYDAFAFVPQALIGVLSDKYPKINMGLIGIFLLLIGLITFSYNLLPGTYTEIIILCLGNCFLHIAGAEATLTTSEGKLASSAIFVSGGSFGVILGKILGKTNISCIIIALLIISTIPFILLANYYRKNLKNKEITFNYHNTKINPGIVIILTVLIVIIRGYMGYGIPTSWNKTLLENVLLYCAMGIGKALGGILSDAYGIKKIAYISIIGALPFLLLGDNYIIISLIGILLFSMTMSITLGILVSIFPKNPGLAFGHTTLGLFLGTVPIFFFKFNTSINMIIISFLTIICLLILPNILREEDSS